MIIEAEIPSVLTRASVRIARLSHLEDRYTPTLRCGSPVLDVRFFEP